MPHVSRCMPRIQRQPSHSWSIRVKGTPNVQNVYARVRLYLGFRALGFGFGPSVGSRFLVPKGLFALLCSGLIEGLDLKIRPNKEFGLNLEKLAH